MKLSGEGLYTSYFKRQQEMANNSYITYAMNKRISVVVNFQQVNQKVVVMHVRKGNKSKWVGKDKLI